MLVHAVRSSRSRVAGVLRECRDVTRSEPHKVGRLVLVRSYYSAAPDAIVHKMGELGEGLAGTGYTVDVLALGNGETDSPLFYLYPHVREVPLSVPVGWLPPRLRRGAAQVGFLLRSAAWLIRRRQTITAVITVDTPLGVGWVGRLVRRVGGGRVRHVHWVMDLLYAQAAALPGGSRRRGLSRVLSQLEIGALRGASPVVVLGRCVGELLVEHGVRAPVVVIPLWADVPDPGPEPSYRPGGEPDGRGFTVLYGGHAAGRNPLAPVAEAARLLAGTAIAFEVLGSGTEVLQLQHIVERDGLSAIVIRGPVPRPEYDEQVRRAGALLVSLHPRTTGMSVPSKTYSAMAAGRPVIYMGAANGQAAMDVVAADAGVVIPHSGTELARVAEQLANDPERVRTLGENGRAFMRGQRSLGSAVDAWRGLVGGA